MKCITKAVPAAIGPTAAICDVATKNCVSEVIDGAPSGGNGSGATAGGLFGLSALVPQAALPGNYGTTMPTGHDAYVVFETTQYGVKFRVFDDRGLLLRLVAEGTTANEKGAATRGPRFAPGGRANVGLRAVTP